MNYYIKKIIETDFQTAIELMKEGLNNEGFKILNEVDIQATFKVQLGIDFQPYTILSACNPVLAFRGLISDNKIGTMLPCNVIIQQLNQSEIEIAILDPLISVLVEGNEDLREVAKEVQEKLKRTFHNLN